MDDTDLTKPDAPDDSAGFDDLAGALLLDVRRTAAYEAAASVIPGSSWHDPANVAAWAGSLPAGRPVVVYCVHGHEVSQGTAAQLRAAGLNARYLRGGISAWQAAGRPLQAKGAASSNG